VLCPWLRIAGRAYAKKRNAITRIAKTTPIITPAPLSSPLRPGVFMIVAIHLYNYVNNGELPVIMYDAVH